MTSVECPVQGKWKGLSTVTFSSVLRRKVYCLFNEFCGISSSRQMKKTFNCHFGSVFRPKFTVTFNDLFESPFQGKWKGFPTVILALDSEKKLEKSLLSPLMTFWKSSSRKMKKSFNSHFGSSFKAKVYCHFQWSVWKSNSRKMKRFFHCHFGFGFRAKVYCLF